MKTILDKFSAAGLITTAMASMRVISLLALIVVLVTVTNSKLQTLRTTNEVYLQGFVSAADRTKQLECLAKNIYWEAATEPFEGKVAVAQVTLNRVESGRFANSVCGVVYQKNVFYDRVVCQFSWYCEANHHVKPVHQALYKESMEVAKKVLLENFRLSSMDEAIYYHADYVRPGWNKTKIKQIGRHIFYKG
jgi:spore germination cell wall hydrolase CwlJ-like protein